MSGVAFVDTETTGLDSDRCPIWEIAVIVPDGPHEGEHVWTQRLPLLPAATAHGTRGRTMGEGDVRSCDECAKPIRAVNTARGLCAACYARWRRNQPDRCRACGGLLGDEPIRDSKSGSVHERCLRNRRQRWGQYRIRVLEGYGGCCACCGESDPRFLTIDHVDGNGAEHRRDLGTGSNRVWLQIIREGFPEGYQCLCYNCNCGRAINGGVCPHHDPLESSAWLAGSHREVEDWIRRRDGVVG